MDYLRNVRNRQIDRTKNKISASNKGEKIKLSINPNDYRKLIKEDIKENKNLEEIEESFRIWKTDFDLGTVYLPREDRIKAHYVTCFISLLIYRILENKLDYKYTNNQIIKKLKEMNMYEEKGTGYSHSYVRDVLTDDLHEKFGFRTD